MNEVVTFPSKPRGVFCPSCAEDVVPLRKLGKTYICSVCQAEWYEEDHPGGTIGLILWEMETSRQKLKPPADSTIRKLKALAFPLAEEFWPLDAMERSLHAVNTAKRLDTLSNQALVGLALNSVWLASRPDTLVLHEMYSRLHPGWEDEEPRPKAAPTQPGELRRIPDFRSEDICARVTDAEWIDLWDGPTMQMRLWINKARAFRNWLSAALPSDEPAQAVTGFDYVECVLRVEIASDTTDKVEAARKALVDQILEFPGQGHDVMVTVHKNGVLPVFESNRTPPSPASIHLRFNLQSASKAGDNRHAQIAMKELGITYQHATPQSMGDCWWFWNCQGIPADLPDYINELKVDPMECIGYGLDRKTAEKIRDASRRKDGELPIVPSDERLFRIHAICRYLRGRPDAPCNLCPATFTEPNHGECVRGCFALAKEVLNIAVHGHPHGERGIELNGQKWREHFNVK